MDFFTGIIRFTFGETGTIPEEFQGPVILLFTTCCALMSIIIVVLDRISYAVIDRSYLNLSYGTKFSTTLRLILLWGLGAGLGGFLGAAFSIVEITRNASIVIGVSWPFILPRIIDSFTSEHVQQDPTVNDENGE